MESAFTGLVRKYRVLFKPNKSITTHNTMITVCRIFIRSRVYFSISSAHCLCVPNPCCLCSSVGAFACQCHRHKRMTEQGVINEN